MIMKLFYWPLMLIIKIRNIKFYNEQIFLSQRCKGTRKQTRQEWWKPFVKAWEAHWCVRDVWWWVKIFCTVILFINCAFCLVSSPLNWPTQYFISFLLLVCKLCKVLSYNRSLLIYTFSCTRWQEAQKVRAPNRHPCDSTGKLIASNSGRAG